MSENITREQYDNAVRIRENRYSCADIYPETECGDCPIQGSEIGCGNIHGLLDKRKDLVNSAISTYEAEHPEEFRKPPRIYDYRDVELPEVQELIGKEVYVSDYIFTMLTEPEPCYSTLESCEISTRPFIDSCGIRWQFIRAIDSPTIRLTRSELIAIAAKSRGVNPELIIVEE